MNTAYVKIWGELVGAVAWNETTGGFLQLTKMFIIINILVNCV